jgi:NAD(P)-dependent dehydrogenase (short-subunit alcohol dehydrogenase family)
MNTLTGKRALITGGASGIGKATAQLFAQEDACVSIVDIDDTRGEAVVQAILDRGGRAIYIHCNVAEVAECKRAVKKTVEQLGGIDILFNNAGIAKRTTVLETSEADWDLVMAVNLKSMFLFSKYTIPYMIEAGAGVIINTASGWGLVGGRKAITYCASKGGVVNMTRALALDHGEQNIRVNCICPGDTDTEMLRDEARQLGQPSESFLMDAANRPLRRIGRPEEIAQAVLYLASDAAAYVTGSALVIDGGGTAG